MEFNNLVFWVVVGYSVFYCCCFVIVNGDWDVFCWFDIMLFGILFVKDFR